MTDYQIHYIHPGTLGTSGALKKSGSLVPETLDTWRDIKNRLKSMTSRGNFKKVSSADLSYISKPTISMT